MKKYLMMGAAALTMGFAFVSCSSDDEIYNPKAKSEQLAKNYAEAFVQQFGQPAANQTWGFGQAAKSRMTRSNNKGEVIKPDETSFPGYSNDRCNSSNYRSPEGYADIVAPITDKEREWVQKWFNENPGLSDEGVDFDDFFVQQVNNKLAKEDKNMKAGYHWTNEGKTETEYTYKDFEVKMDQLRIGPVRDASDDKTLHLKDFNSTNGFNAWNLLYIQGGSSKQFAYYASWGSQWQWLFRCKKLTVPGSCFEDGKARDGYYVGLSYYCEKDEVAGVKGDVIGKDEIEVCNDWILKIVPANVVDEDEVEEEGRIFCEDLGTIGDFDFNDVVFDAKLYKSGKIEIDVLAAGGTLPIAVAGVDIKIGKMSNTGVNDGGTQHISISAEDAAKNKWNSLISIPIVVTRDITDAIDGSVVLTAEKGKAPQKICVPLTTKWVDEYENINKAYPDFAKWVKGDVTREDCFANKVDKYVDLKLPNND